jgi:hypothetical protein
MNASASAAATFGTASAPAVRTPIALNVAAMYPSVLDIQHSLNSIP